MSLSGRILRLVTDERYRAEKGSEANTPQHALLLVSIAGSARITAMIENRAGNDPSYNVSELRGRAEKLDEMAFCYYSQTMRQKELKKMNCLQTPQLALLQASPTLTSRFTSTIEIRADIDGSYDILGVLAELKSQIRWRLAAIRSR